VRPRRGRALANVVVALVLLAAVSLVGWPVVSGWWSSDSVTTGCAPPTGSHISVRRLPNTRLLLAGLEQGAGATVFWGGRWWRLASWDGWLPRPEELVTASAQGTMLRHADDALFRADDGRTFSFSPAVVNCP
jgi:hypothetical protein